VGVIVGHICPGSGRASALHTAARLRARSDAAALRLVPGTLNLRVPNARNALARLGPLVRIEEPWCRIGPGLDLYPVWANAPKLPGVTLAACVTRSENSKAKRIIEVMAETRFRDLGLIDGDALHLVPRTL